MKATDVCPLILLVTVLSARLSKQEKREDCVPGKQYWSTFIISEGTCAECPRYLAICDEQGPDKEACKKSCGAATESVSSSVALSTTPVSSYTGFQVTKVSFTRPSISVTVSSTIFRPSKPTEYGKISDDDETRSWVIVVVALLATGFFLGSIVSVLLLLRKCRERRKNVQRNVNFEFDRPVRPIQETGKKQDSVVHLEETYC